MEGKWWERKGLKKYREHVMSSGRTAEDTEQTHDTTQYKATNLKYLNHYIAWR